MNNQVVLVNENDDEIGLMPKLEAHQKGVLHRAFSIFIFNTKGEMLLQQRAFGKYHSEGLWSNTCCSHPYPNESTLNAAKRLLYEEMGMHSSLHFLYSFRYEATLDKGLIEHELDHIFWAISDAEPQLNREEVLDYKYIPVKDLQKDIRERPEQYTEWFKICLDDVISKIKFQ